MLLPIFRFLVFRISSPVPFEYNEGWTAYNTARVIAGGPLYLSLQQLPLIPVPYPPFFFFIAGAIISFTGNLLTVGRIITLSAFALNGALIFGIVFNFTKNKSGSLFGALLWYCLAIIYVPYYVGMFDPQMLAHIFPLLSLYLYSLWRERLDFKRVVLVALLCCVGLFTKHLLVSVPAALAFTLFWQNRKAFWVFFCSGVVLSTVFLLGIIIYSHGLVLSNFIDLDRIIDYEYMLWKVKFILLERSAILYALPLVFLSTSARRSQYILVFAYTTISFLVAVFTGGTDGTDWNHWFDFLFAVSIAAGSCFGESDLSGMERMLARLKFSNHWIRVLGAVLLGLAVLGNEILIARFLSADGILEDPTKFRIRVLQFILFLAGIDCLTASNERNRLVRRFVLLLVAFITFSPLCEAYYLNMDRQVFGKQDYIYQQDLMLLESIPGPALFEEPLMGFESHKDFLVSPCEVALLMLTKRLPETLLLDLVRRKYFQVVVFRSNTIVRLDKLEKSGDFSVNPEQPESTISVHWTDRTIKEILENYNPLTGRHEESHYRFYVPKSRAEAPG
jgi:hypothetical protein